jgi:hypothetical protein
MIQDVRITPTKIGLAMLIATLMTLPRPLAAQTPSYASEKQQPSSPEKHPATMSLRKSVELCDAVEIYAIFYVDDPDKIKTSKVFEVDVTRKEDVSRVVNEVLRLQFGDRDSSMEATLKSGLPVNARGGGTISFKRAGKIQAVVRCLGGGVAVSVGEELNYVCYKTLTDSFPFGTFFHTLVFSPEHFAKWHGTKVQLQ